MNIETYTDSRKEEILVLVKNMHEEEFKRYDQKLDLECLYQMIEKLRPHSFLLIIDGKCVGVFAGQEVHHPLNNDRVFHQVIWYVDKKYRQYSIFFLKQIIRMIKSLGCKMLVTTLLYNKQFNRRSKLFKKLGFNPLETHFIKNI